MLGVGSVAAGEVSQSPRHRNVAVSVAGEPLADSYSDRNVGTDVAVVETAAVVSAAELPCDRVPRAAVNAAGEVDLTTERPAGHDITESHPSLVMPVAPSTRDSVAGATVDAADVAWHVCTSDVDDAEAVRRSGARKTAVVDERVRRFDELAHELLMTPGVVRLVGIDGCGGAGKTTFAARLAQAAGDAPVVHTDDFASWEEPTQWWPRLLADVIDPLSRGEAATFRPYDWVERRRAHNVVTVAPAPIVVIEGVGAARSAWRDRLVARVWLATSRAERLRRGLERDGEHMLDFWRWWMAAEDRYVSDERPDLHADIRVSGEPSTRHDPEQEFVQIGPGVNELR